MMEKKDAQGDGGKAGPSAPPDEEDLSAMDDDASFPGMTTGKSRFD